MRLGPSGSSEAHAAEAPLRRTRSIEQPVNGPNITTERDLAAGAMIDSIFAPLAPVDPLPRAAAKAMGVDPSKASVRPQWTARLARNPKADDGNPPFVLIDRYGGIQRYVEPSPQVDLDPHVGQTVAVRRDTGHTLLATQLDLPRAPLGGGVADGGVRLAALEEPLPAMEPTPADSDAPAESSIVEGEVVEGEVIEGEGPFFDDTGSPMIVPEGVDPLYLNEGEMASCPTCGSGVCGGCSQGGCGFGSRPIFYARGEYLLWDFDGMNTPPLVVSSQNANFNPATIIYGNDKILDSSRDGWRVRVGYWLDDYGGWAIEGDYFGFATEDEIFIAGDANNSITPPPFIGRPYFNIFPGNDLDGNPATPNIPSDSVEEVDTNNLTGTVRVDTESDFQAAGIHLRRNLCCIAGGGTDCGSGVDCGSAVGGCDGCAGSLSGPGCAAFFKGGTRHVDMIYGVRWAQLDERLGITEDLEVIGPPGSGGIGTTFLVHDNFATANEFVGGEIGFLLDWQRRRWSLELLSKLALGNNRQRVFISGDTFGDPNNGTSTDFKQGGLLAQPSNIGAYERNELSVIPEIGVTAGYLLTQRLKVTAGYTFLYWSSVVRPGDQIDLDVNEEFLDFDPSPLTGPARPEFVLQDTDIWAHGLNVGLDYSW